jgi:hypothetical protein
MQYIGSANATIQLQQCHSLQQLINCQLGPCRTDSDTPLQNPQQIYNTEQHMVSCSMVLTRAMEK